MVPMPMNAARLREYVKTYDIDMDSSVVAVDFVTQDYLAKAKPAFTIEPL